MVNNFNAIQSAFGGDAFRWFIATVVEHIAPRGYEGRVQLRIRGIHPDTTDDVKQVDLPWAQVLVPGTEEGSSGLGRSPKVTTGAQVWGFFLDGKQSQVPVVVGSFTKTEGETPIQALKASGKSDYTYDVNSQAEVYEYVDSVEELHAELKSVKREITEVVVHWTQTYSNKDVSAEELFNMSEGWGAHYIIHRDGSIERGTPVNTEAFHSSFINHNQRSIAIAFVGGISVPSGMPNATDWEDARSLTRSQMNSFDQFVQTFFMVYPGCQVIGARDLADDTNGPGFDVRQYVYDNFGKTSLFTDTPITRVPYTQGEILRTQISSLLSYSNSVENNRVLAGLLDFISLYESDGDYAAVYPRRRQPNILNMTLNELITDMQTRAAKYGSSASGRYQFIQVTMTELAQGLGYNFNTKKFDEKTQDALALRILYTRADLQKWLDAEITTRAFLKKLSQIWASIPNPDTGGSYYSGLGTNKSLVSVEEAIEQLDGLSQ